MSIGIMLMGLFVGFLVGLTGVGGAALLTPILILIGVNPTIAVGTDLVYNSITKFFGTLQHWRQKTVNFTLVKYFAIGSVPSSIVAVSLLYLSDTFYRNQEVIVKHALGYILIAVALSSLFRTIFDSNFKENRWQLRTIQQKKGLTITMGVCLGFIVGLTSVGSGSLVAIALLYFFRLKSSELVGTDIAHAFFLVTAAGFMHASFGSVNFPLVFNLLIGSIPGVIVGSSLSAKIPTKPLRAVVCVVILLSGIKMI
ncbi:hypothetical protein BEP19_10290 [Ammoniphilus oxalaticus]|uniref:Probable membrane transporter protein n=1 Tax=Ammoniphilus oxalaticus TaxID=66863 RepID=A0A419SFS3_9BACL|nr:sulfite exporter TauE/SafE family protein [Ammoniphilus oxalaticus]RKD22641.1 hypothetical protein BEP19_10290 [Ammoniphilus oxalaticus]